MAGIVQKSGAWFNYGDIRLGQGRDNAKQFLSRVQSVLDIIESDAPNDLKAEALRGIVRKIVFYKDTNTLEFHYYLMVE